MASTISKALVNKIQALLLCSLSILFLTKEASVQRHIDLYTLMFIKMLSRLDGTTVKQVTAH